jgi:hypothetical protein
VDRFHRRLPEARRHTLVPTLQTWLKECYWLGIETLEQGSLFSGYLGLLSIYLVRHLNCLNQLPPVLFLKTVFDFWCLIYVVKDRPRLVKLVLWDSVKWRWNPDLVVQYNTLHVLKYISITELPEWQHTRVSICGRPVSWHSLFLSVSKHLIHQVTIQVNVEIEPLAAHWEYLAAPRNALMHQKAFSQDWMAVVHDGIC